MNIINHVVSLEVSKQLKEAGWKKETESWWVNSSYSSGWEGGDVIWLCDEQWNLLNFIPDPECHDTGIIDKEQGLIPDYINPSGHYDKHYHNKYFTIAKEKIIKLKVYSAPLATEILEELPYNTEINKWDNIYRVTINNKEFNSVPAYGARALPDALAKMWIYLKKK